ncbi:MAG: MFS transporter [Pseudomonadota bacterium]
MTAARPLGKRKLTTIASISVAHEIPAALLQVLVPIIYTRSLGLPLSGAWVFSIPIAVTALKWTWAPLVDRYGSDTFGRRRSWLIPAAFLVSFLYAFISNIEPTLENVALMVGLFVIVKIVFSTYEIAGDAYVAEALGAGQRGVGSAAVWIGKEMGQIIGLAGTLAIADKFGWSAAFLFVACLFSLLNLIVLIRPEDPPSANAQANRLAGRSASPWFYLRNSVNREVLLIVFFFSLAVQMPPAAIGLFLTSKGLSLSETGIAIGVSATLGAAVSLALAGPAIKRLGLKRFSVWMIPIGLLALPGFIWLTFIDEPGILIVAAVIFLGALFTAPIRMCFYAARIGWTSKSQVGTDFTIQQSIWFLGYATSFSFSVWLADKAGFFAFFVTNAVLVTMMMAVFVLRHDSIAGRIAALQASEDPTQSPKPTKANLTDNQKLLDLRGEQT